MTPAVTPNWGRPTEQENSGAPNVDDSEVRQNLSTVNAEEVFEESFCRKGSWRPDATFTEGFPFISHEDQFSS